MTGSPTDILHNAVKLSNGRRNIRMADGRWQMADVINPFIQLITIPLLVRMDKFPFSDRLEILPVPAVSPRLYGRDQKNGIKYRILGKFDYIDFLNARQPSIHGGYRHSAMLFIQLGNVNLDSGDNREYRQRTRFSIRVHARKESKLLKQTAPAA